MKTLAAGNILKELETPAAGNICKELKTLAAGNISQGNQNSSCWKYIQIN